MTPEIEGIDERIIATIDRIRAQYFACTMRIVAAELQLSTTYIQQQCWRLQAQGRINYSKVPGSLIVVHDGATVDVPTSQPSKQVPKKKVTAPE